MVFTTRESFLELLFCVCLISKNESENYRIYLFKNKWRMLEFSKNVKTGYKRMWKFHIKDAQPTRQL